MSSKKETLLIIDGAGTSTAQNVMHALGGYPYTISLDCSKINVGKFFSDEFLECPKATSPDFVPFLHSLFEEKLKSFSKILYVPIIDYGFKDISRTKFDDRVLVMLSPYKTINICDDKLEMSRFFRSFINPFSLPKDMDAIRVQAATFSDIIIKPKRNGRGSLDVSTCNDITVFNAQKKYLGDNFYFQEKISGREVTVDVLCTLGGRYLGSICRERVEVKAGVCSKAKIFHSWYYDNIVKFICSKLEFRGHINIQFIENTNGVYLIEINPRYSGGYNLSEAAGFHSVDVMRAMFYEWGKGTYDDSMDFRRYYGNPYDGGSRIDSLCYTEGYAYKYSGVEFEPVEFNFNK